MTDEEILKRLAEIEGKDYYDTQETWEWDDRQDDEVIFPPLWNPLTDWSDLGPLIEKHQIDITWHGYDDEKPYVRAWHEESVTPVEHKSLPHAICLAIIEAHDLQALEGAG